MKWFYTLLFLLIVYPSILFTQTVRYVDQSGGYPGSYLTITDAVTAATSGDTLKIFSGTYNEAVTINKKLFIYAQDSTAEVVSATNAFTFTSGSSGSLLYGFTLKGHVYHDNSFNQSEPIVIDNNRFFGKYINFRYWTIIANNFFQKSSDGFAINTSGTDSTHKRIVIFNNRLDTCGIQAIGGYTDIIGNDINNLPGYGISLGGNIIDDRVISNKVNNCSYGITVSGYPIPDCIFVNNVITNCNTGIAQTYAYMVSNHILIINNIIHNTTNSIVIPDATGYRGTTNLFGNILTGNTDDILCPVCVFNYNCFYNSGTVPAGIGNISSNPLFTNPGTGDFTLQAGSPAINAGHPNVLYSDIDRTRNDMGIYGGSHSMANYEYNSGPKIFSLTPIPVGVIKGNSVTITGSGVAK